MKQGYKWRSMGRALAFLLLFIALAGTLWGQSITNYTFAASSGSYTALSEATTATLSVGTTDEGAYNAVPIGFTFTYMGNSYTTVSLSTNGWMTFGQNISSYALSNALATGGSRPVLAPLWDDNDMEFGSVQYKTEGSAPNRVFTIQAANVAWNYNASGGVLSYQIKLYESTGAVEFVYNQEASSVNSGSASIGITATATGAGNYLSLNGTGVAPTASSTSETTSLSSKPASGQVFTFTPPADAPLAPTGLNFTSVGTSGMTLNWTDNATTESGYRIDRSTDGINYTAVASLVANSTSYAATGLAPSTLYYWRVFAVSEAKVSTSLDGTQSTSAPTLSGPRSVGPTGDYATLTAAIADVQNLGLAGAMILELQTTYSGAGETLPITIGALPGSSAANTLTIRPATGSVGLVINGSNATAILDLNGADYVIIDGRPGGTGDSRQLALQNTSTSGATVRFINDATNNTIRNVNLEGVVTSTTSGVVLFSTTTGTTGNDDNTISYCHIRETSTTPINGVYAAGTASKTNDNNTISNCNIFNFFNASSDNAGIKITSNNTSWSILNNSFYQTTSRTYSSGVFSYPISIVNTSGNGFTVSGNYIGGTAENCGSTPWTVSGSSNRFLGIDVQVSTTGTSSIQGNTIGNLTFSTTSGATSTPYVYSGIRVVGNVNIGTVTANSVGTATLPISWTSSTTSGVSAGIVISAGTGATVDCRNNTITNISILGSTTSIGHSFLGIENTTGGTVTIQGNTIGSSTVANAINLATATSGTLVQAFTGIRNALSSLPTVTIASNTIANINNATTSTSASSVTFGIRFSTGMGTVTNNTIRNLTTASAGTGTGTTPTLAGIMWASTTSGLSQIISGNTIHSLYNTAATAAVSVYGIYYAGLTSGTNSITKNFVHSLSIVSTSATADLRGIVLASGLVAVTNNLVRLGINAAGDPLTTGIQINGIIDQTSTTGSSIDHNSVYIGGTGVGTQTGETYAFRSNQTLNTRSYRNNILVNDRSNATTGGKHFAVRVAGTGVNPTGLTLNYNIYRATGTGAVFGYYGADQATFANWQVATGQDANSAVTDPNFVAPMGNSTTVDLHVQSPTPAEGSGTAIAAVTEDFDGQTRADFTPVDIGADAGNFTGVDAFPPVIAYVALTNTASTGNRTLASVTITDQTGVPTVGILQPRIWFRRSSDPASTWASVQGTLQSGNAVNGVWNFVIDYSALSIVPVIGETYQYYLAVQDAAGIPNVTTSPLGGVHVDVNTQTSPPGTPSQYSIVAGFTGAYTVPGSYPNLSNSGGLFEAINAGVLTGNVTVSITADITTEDGQHALNQWANDGGTWNLTIQPDGTTERVISGNVSNGMIRLNGADRVTIDGRSGGSGRYLRFKNLSTAHPTFTLLNDASNNTITNCFIEGSSTQSTNGVIFFTTGTTTGNDNNTVTNCVIRDRSDAAGVPANLIYSAGFSATITNTGNTISGNEMFNFTARGIQTTSTGNENWTISGNEIYQAASRTTALYGIDFNSLGTNLITLNTIRSLNTTVEVRGILINDARGTTISRNKISMIDVNGGTSAWTGIYLNGSSGTAVSVTLVNNQVTLIPLTSTSMTIRGIYDWMYTGNTLNGYYNSVLVGGTATGSTTWAYQRATSSPSTSLLRNNLFFNNRTGGTVNHFALGDQSSGSGTFNVSNNVYVGTGITAANFMDRGTNSAGTAESFSAWKTAKTDLASFGSVAVDITAANLFTSPATGDLNIITDNTESWTVNGKGVAIVGFADDFGATGVRSVTAGAATDIGSDEFTPTGAAVNAPAATASGLPVASTTTTYTVTGNQVGSIVWGAGGTVPTSLTFRYYSGSQAPSVAPGDRAYLYYDISQAGGSGYTYDITLSYDEGQLNGIAEADLRPVKSTDGGNTWTPYLTVGTGPGQYQINTTANTITIYGLTDFSLFTLTSQSSPLPVQLSAFNVTTESRNALLSWETATEENAFKFVVERKNTESATWSETGEVKASGNSNSPKKYNYTDQKLNSGKYNYRLKMIDNDGTFTYSDVVEVDISVPKDYAVSQNYPNPFNPTTKIDYQLPFDSRVQIELYNITGERVATLVNMDQKAGYYTFDFTNTSHLSSGVYIYRIIATGAAQDKPFTAVKKMVMMK